MQNPLYSYTEIYLLLLLLLLLLLTAKKTRANVFMFTEYLYYEIFGGL